jgi:cell division protein FtsL
MIIRGKIFVFIFITLCLAFSVYFFENKVHEVTDKIQSTQEKLNRHEEDLKVLEAEWSYLNDPQRLTSIAEKVFTDMNSPAKLQYTTLADLPDREVMLSNNNSATLTTP